MRFHELEGGEKLTENDKMTESFSVCTFFQRGICLSSYLKFYQNLRLFGERNCEIILNAKIEN